MSIGTIINGISRFLSASIPPRAEQNLPGTFKNGSPRDAALVIDASGSMYDTDWKPSRLQAAQEAARAFVKRLASEEPNAKVAVIGYGDDANVLCSLTAVTNYKKLCCSIDSICNMGCTNIAAGIEKALNLLKSNQSTGQVVLLTDGCHNTGPDPKPISDKLRKHAVIECVGIGGSPADVDEELLKYIASSYPHGSKRYRWIGDKERLVQHFHNLAGRIVRA